MFGFKSTRELLLEERRKNASLQAELTKTNADLKNIKADGYATSLTYVEDVTKIIDTWNLTQYDDNASAKEEKTVGYTNSSLISYTKLSPNHSGTRTHNIDRITPHCVVGQLSAESICACFTSTDRQASCNYGIGTDGRISLCVEEKNRSWCSSSRANDQRAITIECSSDNYAPYAMTDAVYQSLINLCVDICKRYNKTKLLWLADKDTALNYEPKAGEMVLTVHRWFAAKECPGDWLYSRLGDLASQVTAQLTGNATEEVPEEKAEETATETLYRVQTGAFAIKANAQNLAAKLQALNFDIYVVQADNLYKVQVGAYAVRANAEVQMQKLKDAGYDAFITTKSGTLVS